MSDKDKRKLMPIWAVITIDLVSIGATLVTFAYFHHVRKSALSTEGTVISGNTETATPTETTAAEEEEIVVKTDWEVRFADHFTDTVVTTDNSYSSPDISITVDTVTLGSGNSKITYYVADVYIADIECFQTYFALDTYGTGYRESVLDMDTASEALLAISGDYYGNSQSYEDGVVIRNGILYRASDTDCDICILYYDGTMVTYSPDEFDAKEAIESGAWQAWTFGPELLGSDGDILTGFNTSNRLLGDNPRAGIGYYEPGHYCLIVVDGRDTGYSAGVSIQEFSGIFRELGCVSAYNLDGGKSAVMTYDDSVVNQPTEGGRTISDCLIIKEAD